MPQLDTVWFSSQLFWLSVCFAVLYLLLSRFLLPPLQNVIASRKLAIDSDLDVAQDLKLKAEQARVSYETTLAESRVTAQSLINEAEVVAKIRAEEAIKAIDSQIATQSLNASSAIVAKKQELLDSLMPATVEFASLIVEKFIKQPPNAV